MPRSSRCPLSNTRRRPTSPPFILDAPSWYPRPDRHYRDEGLPGRPDLAPRGDATLPLQPASLANRRVLALDQRGRRLTVPHY
jgi:hypothetical protein